MARRPKPHQVRTGGRWRFRLAGRVYYADTERECYQRLYELLAAGGAPDRSGQPRLIGGAIDRYVATFGRRRHLARLFDFGAKQPLAAVGVDFLREYVQWLRKQPALTTHRRPGGGWERSELGRPLGPAGIAAHVQDAASLLGWCWRQRWIPVLPDRPRLPMVPHGPRDLNDEQLAEVFRNLAADGRTKHAARIMRFIYVTGCRPSEAIRLTWADVHADRRVALLAEHKTAGKSGRARTILLNDDALAILAELRPGPGHVFLNRFRKPYTNTGTLGKVFRDHAPKGTTLYGLRHSHAQHLIDAGVAAEDVSFALGHSSLRQTQVYAQVRAQRALAAVQSVRLLPAADGKGARSG